jgi:hypothetical protein
MCAIVVGEGSLLGVLLCEGVNTCIHTANTCIHIGIGEGSLLGVLLCEGVKM